MVCFPGRPLFDVANVSGYDAGRKVLCAGIYLAKIARDATISVRDDESTIMKKQIRLNAFAMNCVAHQSPGLWTHPRDRTIDYNRLPYWIDLAKTLECGRFDGLFLADVLDRKSTRLNSSHYSI